MHNRSNIVSRNRWTAAFTVLGILAAANAAKAVPCDPPPPPVTGTDLPTLYAGAPNALQDNPTQFGDATPPTQAPSQGNEVDRLFIRNTGSTLDIGVTGNTFRVDTFQNTVLVFIDTGNNGGTAVLNTAGITGSNALKNMSGVTLDFAPEYCLAVWNETINQVLTQRAILHNLTIPADTGTTLTEGAQFEVNNSNLQGVTAEPAHDPVQQEQNAATAVTGFEFAIPLSMLTPLTSTSPIKVQVLLVGGDGTISNQSLPPLNPTNGTAGGGVGNVGKHDPAATPPNLVDFSDNIRFPGTQAVNYTLSSPGAAPGGTLDGADITVANYGATLSTQNNYTGFANAAPFSPLPTAGSELDQIWVANDFSKLYIGITGNVPSFDDINNTILIFIDNGNGRGTNPLITAGLPGGSGALQGMEGVSFDTGFAPYYVIEYWRGAGRHNAIYQDVEFGVVHEMEFSTDSARHLLSAVQAFSADLSNILGINGIRGDDPLRQEARNGAPATRATSGVQFSINMNELGIDPQALPLDIKVAAIIVSAAGFISNQSLPPLNPTDNTPVTANPTFSSAPLPLAIPDNPATPASDARIVSAPNITRITDVNVSVNITHPDVSQLAIALTAGNRTVLLKAAGTGSGANLNVTYDSEGGGGTVLPAQSLLTFNDLDPNTNWTIVVTDSVSGQSGTLNSWGLQLTMYKGGAVNCLGNFDSVDNPIDFSTATFPGNQFTSITLNQAVNRPSSFSGQNIPTAFLPNNPLSSQNNYTCFIDSQTAPPVNLPGSEMDQMIIKNSNDRLKVAVTGNLENNGNAFVLFLDTVSGGQSTITGQTSPPGSVAGLNNLSFDTGFVPDYAFAVQRDATAGVPNDDYNVFSKTLTTNNTRTLGRLTRGSSSGLLSDAIPNQNGSELDQLYLQNDAARLYVGITGNLEANGNTIFVFLETGGGGPSRTLDTNYTGFPAALKNLNGDSLDIGFQPNFCVVLDRSGGTFHAQLVDLTDLPPGVTVTNLILTSTIGDNTYFWDNTNAAGVNNVSADDPTQQATNAATAVRGIQLALARGSIGNPADGSTIHAAAYLACGCGSWSNQLLPPLGGGQDNLSAYFPTTTDLSDATHCPGNQFVSYALAGSGSYAQPSSFTGSLVSTSMGAAKATQNNYTGYGNTLLVNPGNANCVQVAFSDSNILGVTASSAVNAGTATSGMEFDIPFADIGLTPLNMGGQLVTIKAFAVLTGNTGYLSDQMLPGAGRVIVNGQGNPTNLGFVPGAGLNLGDNNPTTGFPGNQFLTYTLMVPCTDDPADINNDGVRNTADATAFANVLLGFNNTACALQKSDFNRDGSRNGKDVQGFVQAFLAP